MKFDVVTFGSSFVDVYLSSKDFKVKDNLLCQSYGSKIAVDKLVITTGGGASNVAVGLERLGLQTGCVTCVGKDHWGLFIRQELRKEGVSPLYIQQVDEQTSCSTILVSADGGRSALVYRGASNKLSWHKVEWDKLEPDWFYVSSLGGDLNLLTKIIRTAQLKKIKVALNPGSKEIQAEEKLKAFLPYVETLIVNREEAAKLTKHEFKNKEEILTDLKKLGPRITAMTEGRKGATLLEGRKVITLPAVKTETVEETGAGDGFGCGLVAGLIKFTSLEKALKLGLANGASVVEHFGPKDGLLFEPEMESWLKKL
ncbi:MAG: carbohydrate kinase family protein [Actinomycetia bacterium]|nr:carbohydrate kinase family protein [Microgenomates group bacterium]MCG2790959.1 carbohydrate kinase family protein [Actinomycetes bacterium]